MNANAFRHFYDYHIAENRKTWYQYVTQLSDRQFTAGQNRPHGCVRDQIVHIIQYFIQDRFQAIGGLCVNPEAGEGFYLTREEKKRIVEIAVEVSDGKMPVISGTYATNTAEVVETAKDVKAAGGDGLFAIPPGGCGDITGYWDADSYPEV